MNRARLLRRLYAGALHNVTFTDMVDLVEGFGFVLVRVNGSYHVFHKGDVGGLSNMHEGGGEEKSKPMRTKDGWS